MIGAHVEGFAAHVVDKLLARHLPSLLVAMAPEQRAEVLAMQAAVRQSAAWWSSVSSAEVGNAAVRGAGESSSSTAQEVGVLEASRLLELQVRQVRNIARRWEPEGLARKVGVVWLLDRAAVEVLAQARSRRSA